MLLCRGIRTYHAAKFLADNEELITPWFKSYSEVADFVVSKGGSVKEVYVRKGPDLWKIDLFGKVKISA